jgi:hypothetical protein
MMELKRMIDDLGMQTYPLGKVIETLKRIAQTSDNPGIFPYQVIRAVDKYRGGFDSFLKQFADGRNGFTYLAPIYIICLIEKNKVLLRSYRIMYPPQYLRE